MEIHLENNFIRLEPSDWRWSAAIVGLCKYFEYIDIPLKIDEDGIEFNSKEITEEQYLLFVEDFFSDSMHHIFVENKLKTDNLDDNKIKEINQKLVANTVMKKYFTPIKLENPQIQEILDTIKKNRLELIKQTYKSGKSLYANFCNDNNLFQENCNSCRLRGYSIDMGKKSKSIAFMRNKKSTIVSDSKYLDFVPFAFSKTREAFFINNNTDIKKLVESNKIFPDSDSQSIRSKIFDKTMNASTFIDYDVEIISKVREKDFYETIFLRTDAIKIFEKLGNLNTDKFNLFEFLQKPCNLKSRENSPEKWVDIQKEVTNNIMNNFYLDNLIEAVFKSFRQDKFLNYYLIKINQLIYTGGEFMGFKEKEIIKIAAAINTKLPNNKLNSYKQKLISAISLKDYDRVQVILIQLSAYSNIKMDFLVDLFSDFQKNKNLAYTFINSLGN